MLDAKLLTFDIETKPATAYVWQLYDVNVSLSQMIAPGGTICIGYKWNHEKKTHVLTEWGDGWQGMLERFAEQWQKADALITYNGNRFDIKKLQGEMCKAGLNPPPPCASIDLYATVSRQFGYDSKKLNHVAPLLGLGTKLKHDGQDLWNAVLAGDAKARKLMERYCRQDVKLTEELYHRIKPYIRNHPYIADVSPDKCPACNSFDVQRRGRRRTKSFWIARIHCQDCGSWSDGSRVKVA